MQKLLCGVLRMAGFPVDMLESFRLPSGDLAYSEFSDGYHRISNDLSRTFYTNESLREAIWLSSAEAYKMLDGYQPINGSSRDSKQRRKEQLLTKYLYRFCTKNDTTSFFGPTAYVNFDVKQRQSMRVEVGDPIADRSRTKAYPASWAEGIPAELLETYANAHGINAKSDALATINEKVSRSEMKYPWKWYAERAPVFELCPANVSMTIGGTLLEDITREMGRLFDLSDAYTLMMHAEAIRRGYYQKIYEYMMDVVGSTALLKWYEHFYTTDLSSLIQIREEMAHCALKILDSLLVADPIPSHSSHCEGRILSPFFSPDILIASESVDCINDGKYEFVVGDCHTTLTSFQRLFTHNLTEQQLGHFADLLNNDVFDNVGYYVPKRAIPAVFEWPEEFRIKNDCRDLQVRLSDGELVFNEPGAYIEYFYNDIISKVIPLNVFEILRSYRNGDTVRLGKTIVQRESKSLLASDYLSYVDRRSDIRTPHTLTDLYESLVRTRAYFARKGFSGIVFVKPDCEYKPFALDLDNPISCEVLIKYARKSKEILLKAMRPGVSELWLNNPQGKFTCELRTAMYRGSQQ